MDDALGVEGLIYELDNFQYDFDSLQFREHSVPRLIALYVLFNLNLVSLNVPGARVYLEVTWRPDWLALFSYKFECV